MCFLPERERERATSAMVRLISTLPNVKEYKVSMTNRRVYRRNNILCMYKYVCGSRLQSLVKSQKLDLMCTYTSMKDENCKMRERGESKRCQKKILDTISQWLTWSDWANCVFRSKPLLTNDHIFMSLCLSTTS